MDYYRNYTTSVSPIIIKSGSIPPTKNTPYNKCHTCHHNGWINYPSTDHKCFFGDEFPSHKQDALVVPVRWDGPIQFKGPIRFTVMYHSQRVALYAQWDPMPSDQKRKHVALGWLAFAVVMRPCYKWMELSTTSDNVWIKFSWLPPASVKDELPVKYL